MTDEPEFRTTLLAGLSELGIRLEAGPIEQLDHFRRLLLDENLRQNLTTLESDYQFAVKHVLDSLCCLQLGLFDRPGRLVDLGTGAGFPGLPLKIARPHLTTFLVDSLRKRTAFLERVVEQLGLAQCQVVTERAENLGRAAPWRESFDLAVVRAVAALPVLVEYAVPLLARGGHLVAMKGPGFAAELESGAEAADLLGARVESVVQLSLPLSGEARALVVLRKERATPAVYPRRVGVPAKRPLKGPSPMGGVGKPTPNR